MKKSTGILLFVIFIFIAIALDSRRLEHFGFVCDLIDNSHGRCTLRGVWQNPAKYGGYDSSADPSVYQLGAKNIDKWASKCSNHGYADISCRDEKASDKTYEVLLEDGSMITKNLEVPEGESDRLCSMETNSMRESDSFPGN
jgi:hypothetical protein